MIKRSKKFYLFFKYLFSYSIVSEIITILDDSNESKSSDIISEIESLSVEVISGSGGCYYSLKNLKNYCHLDQVNQVVSASI